MLAMVLRRTGNLLESEDRPIPAPAAGQVLLRVRACAVCRTDLHVVDGDLPNVKLPIVPGHEIIGEVAAKGPDARRFSAGDLVGVGWLGGTCGECSYCRAGRENLCDRPIFTGCTTDGGFAEYAVADERFCFAAPTGYSAPSAA
ncbi:MAG TPA: alcohol dehydrogenase catalytic domain-containing protein, partial [Planctomycetia bacterium]|nr:alcohol dehydrogenase catalytic domain-containing protein [Planctomycetia bacterium]